MSENTKVTKKRKRESTIIHVRPLQVRENEITLNSSGGPEYLRTQREYC